jgi:hypothetical protein
MLRASELVLFVAPFVGLAILYAVIYRGHGVSRRALLLAVAMVAGVGVYLVWLGTSQRLDRDERYVPALLHNGDIVQGHGAGP